MFYDKNYDKKIKMCDVDDLKNKKKNVVVNLKED